VTEHNVLVVAKYYSCITTKRLAVLLDLPAPATEKALATMVVDGAVSAKIDRPAGTVT
jgi:26S proteasome regulatory subunit N5